MNHVLPLVLSPRGRLRPSVRQPQSMYSTITNAWGIALKRGRDSSCWSVSCYSKYHNFLTHPTDSPAASSQLSIATSTSRTKWACASPNAGEGVSDFLRRLEAAGAL